MSEENRPPEDEQPLAKPVHEQLARPVGGAQEEAAQAEGGQREARGLEEEEKDPISKAVGKAREKGF